MQTIKKPTLLTENTKKKLYISGIIFGMAAIALVAPEFISHVSGFDTFTIQILAVIVFAASDIYFLYAARCPYCGLRLAIYAIQHESIGNWLNWVLTAKKCPKCNQPNNDVAA